MDKKASYKPYTDADKRRTSAYRLIRLLLDAPDLHPSHRREFLKLALYKITEAEAGKHQLRYRSTGSLAANAKKLIHEHVYERAKMASDLLTNPSEMDRILGRAVACIVTEEEHQLLAAAGKRDPRLDGWDRYRAAGIAVIDMATGEYASGLSPVDLKRLPKP